MKHYSVLKSEALRYLNLKANGIYVDATLGYGGHSSEILEKIPEGMLYAFDQDQEAIQYSKERLEKIGTNFELIHCNFVHMKEELLQRGITKVDGILFDLGVSSPQIDDESRGFSFMREEKLDMRMDQTKDFDARELLLTYSYERLCEVFFRYGEESRSRQIAKKIVDTRKEKPIETTMELVSIIEDAVGANYFYKKHPERNIFQAIRIEVNQELLVLEKVLPDAISLLKKEGRICVITFHSLEDRITKNIFKQYASVDEMVKGLPEIPFEYQPVIQIVTKKPIVPGDEELKENRRSKSAKLRVIERIKEDEED
ncbi:MAG: 16S rRNA (cytosine(1402)-N(4))-methyltransferase RsmH [Bacilli bacterium]|nr:16S rRNA (cytosine(1402)-N(4))-methyltransferase RsmH [Bacilli bacterium]